MRLFCKINSFARCSDDSSPNYGKEKAGLRFWSCGSCSKISDAWDDYEPPESMRQFFSYPSGISTLGLILSAIFFVLAYIRLS
jgi:hypothetical protein